jgi:hypothetical protein
MEDPVSDIDESTTWRVIHAERTSMADIMATLTPTQWSTPSLCEGWTVQQTAGHIVVGAEQSNGKNANFPVGTKRRIEGLRLHASDLDWTHGTGPEISGAGVSLLLAMTGRMPGLEDLSGDGLHTLRGRMTAVRS